MIWAFFIIFAVGLTLLFGAPYLDFLTPSDTIFLVDTASNECTPLAQGAETLWFQWQSWGYIALFCLMLTMVLGFLYGVMSKLADKDLIEAKQKWAEKANELEEVKLHYKKKIEQDVKRSLSVESERLNKLNQELQREKIETKLKRQETWEWKEQARHSTNYQRKIANSKLKQRDRLSEQKKLIATFLNDIDWQFTNGSKITYDALLKLSRKHSER